LNELVAPSPGPPAASAPSTLAPAPAASPGLAGQPRHWYVLYSKPRKEHFTRRQLESRGIEVFLPLLRLPGYLPRRQHLVPLFPSYLFVRIHISGTALDEYHRVRWSPGVTRFVGMEHAPAPVDDSAVLFLMERAHFAALRASSISPRTPEGA
jgi:transcription antitermination factor NusG